MSLKDNSHSSNYISRTIKGRNINLPEGPKYDEEGPVEGENFDPLVGRQSMLHSLSVLHYNDFADVGPGLKSSIDTVESRYFNGNTAKGYRNPSGSMIVDTFDEDGVNHAMQYKWGDFLFVDSYGVLPNNHLITLRRFPNPCGDNLLNNLDNPDRDFSRMLGYIDGEANTFESIFNFSCGFNYKEFESEIQTMDRAKTGWGGLDFLGYADTGDRFAKEKLQGKAKTQFDPYTEHRNNFTWGPIDVIDKITTRDRGLKFEQDLTVKFKYAVRSFDGISTKVAFMDILGNMLNMVSNKAPFWGGAVRFHGGGGYSGPLGDNKKLMSGDMDGFLASFMGDIGSKLEAPFEGGFFNGLKNIAGNVGAALTGAGLDKLGRPEMFSLFSLLNGQPTGEWHLTVGNPFNPSMMIGNLIMEDATWGVEGPFTADDVPSFLTLEVKLKHAMARDKYGIQKMFNFGTTRFYGSNTDFDNKSYYRNRMNGNGGSGVKQRKPLPLRVADTTGKIATEDGASVAYAKSTANKYNTFSRNSTTAGA